MAINWNYEVQEEQEYGLIPAGEYRLRIANVEERKDKNGCDAINIMFDVSGKNQKIFYWLSFNFNNAQLVNQKLQSIYDSFGIKRGDFNFATWKGKVGGAKIRHTKDDYGEKAEVHYFLNKKQQEKLPAWVEGSTSTSTTANKDFVADIPMEDIQF